MFRLKSHIVRNRKTLVLIVGVLLALLITLKSNELFSVNQKTSFHQEITSPESVNDISKWLNKLKKNSQYIYHTYQSIRKSQN